MEVEPLDKLMNLILKSPHSLNFEVSFHPEKYIHRWLN